MVARSDIHRDRRHPDERTVHLDPNARLVRANLDQGRVQPRQVSRGVLADCAARVKERVAGLIADGLAERKGVFR